jgi:hypothetical protein
VHDLAAASDLGESLRALESRRFEDGLCGVPELGLSS